MGKRYILIGMCLLLAAGLFSSCRRDEGDGPVMSEEYIVLDAAPSADGTKAFLNRGDLTVNGTAFRMFDYLSGYTGTISGHSDGEEYQYFDNTLTYYPAATSEWKWVFGSTSSPTSYRWTRTGTHHFFGWLMTDGHDTANLNTTSFFGAGYEPGTKTVTLTKTLTADGQQYDFLYSDVVPVDVINDGIPSKVDIPMSHMFGAIGVALSNTSDMDVIVYSVKIYNFPNNGSTTLNYDMADGVTVVHPDPSPSGDYWPNNVFGSAITLYNKDHANAGKTYDAYTGLEETELAPLQYRMAWPMSLSAVAPIVDHLEEDGSVVLTSGSPRIEVDCKVGSQARKTLKVAFPTANNPTAAITAGRKTRLNLNFANKQVILSYEVLPWQYEDFPMAFEGDAISTTQLKFADGTYQKGASKLIDAEGNKHDVIPLISGSSAGSWIAKGTFKAYTPVNAVLSVGLSGNTEDFIVELDSGEHLVGTGGGSSTITINPKRDGGQITLTIRPRGTARSGSKVFLHFAVRNNGRDSDADSEINRDAFVVTIP